MRINREQSICEWVDVKPSTPEPGTKLGVAIKTLGQHPVNGLRIKPENGTNGWYIWCGKEMSKDDDFFSPLHVEHIDKYLPEIKDYLDLPSGYRFLIDGNDYEDVWFDSEL